MVNLILSELCKGVVALIFCLPCSCNFINHHSIYHRLWYIHHELIICIHYIKGERVLKGRKIYQSLQSGHWALGCTMDSVSYCVDENNRTLGAYIMNYITELIVF